MSPKYLYILFVVSFFGLTNDIYGQPINDLCENTLQLPLDIESYCSNNAEFTIVNATENGLSAPDCWSNSNNDVWFSFVAIATDITITVNGNSGIAGGGSLNGPQVAIYSGDCTGTTSQIGCESDNSNTGIIQMYEGGLTPGVTYWIRIDGVNSSVGTFQLCLKSRNNIMQGYPDKKKSSFYMYINIYLTK